MYKSRLLNNGKTAYIPLRDLRIVKFSDSFWDGLCKLILETLRAPMTTTSSSGRPSRSSLSLEVLIALVPE